MPHNCGPASLYNVNIDFAKGLKYKTLPPMSQAALRAPGGLVVSDEGYVRPDSRSLELAAEQEAAICKQLQDLNPETTLQCPSVFKLPQIQSYLKGIHPYAKPNFSFTPKIVGDWYEGYYWDRPNITRTAKFYSGALKAFEDYLPQLDCDPEFQQAAQTYYQKLKDEIKTTLPQPGSRVFVTLADHEVLTGYNGVSAPAMQDNRIVELKQTEVQGETLASLKAILAPEAYQSAILPFENLAVQFGKDEDYFNSLNWTVTVVSAEPKPESDSQGCGGTGIGR